MKTIVTKDEIAKEVGERGSSVNIFRVNKMLRKDEIARKGGGSR